MSSPHYVKALGGGLKKLRIAVVKEGFGSADSMAGRAISPISSRRRTIRYSRNLTGRHFEDATVLRVARAYEQA